MSQARIIRGDSLRVLRGMPVRGVDLVVTSPPYNIGKEYERRTAMAQYEEWITPIVEASVRVLKDGGWACWQVGNHITGTGQSREVLPLDFFFIPLLTKAGLKYRARIIWHFGHGLHNTHSFSGRHETIICFSKGRPTHSIAPLLKRAGDAWKVTNVKHNHPEKTAHPCQFPEALVSPLIHELTDADDLVLDPFGGAGTVAAAAMKLGRRAIHIDRDASYCAIARKRLAGIQAVTDRTPPRISRRPRTPSQIEEVERLLRQSR